MKRRILVSELFDESRTNRAKKKKKTLNRSGAPWGRQETSGLTRLGTVKKKKVRGEKDEGQGIVGR